MLTTSDGDLAPTGRADYVLLDQRGRPLAIIESQEAGDPALHRQAAGLPYAKQIGAPFIFLTNGELIYFWDYQNDDARIVHSFFSRRDLERLVRLRADAQAARDVADPRHYIRQGETRSFAPTRRKPCRRSTARSSWASAAS